MSKLCAFVDNGGAWKCTACGRHATKWSETPPVAGCGEHRAFFAQPGPGTELKSLLEEWLGITATPGCECNSMAAKMNHLGPDWCESAAGLAEILGVMRDEHGKRRADGRTKLPWTDFGAAQLVKLACRRARAKAENQKAI
jgi:hypothetical protein